MIFDDDYDGDGRFNRNSGNGVGNNGGKFGGGLFGSGIGNGWGNNGNGGGRWKDGGNWKFGGNRGRPGFRDGSSSEEDMNVNSIWFIGGEKSDKEAKTKRKVLRRGWDFAQDSSEEDDIQWMRHVFSLARECICHKKQNGGDQGNGGTTPKPGVISPTLPPDVPKNEIPLPGQPIMSILPVPSDAFQGPQNDEKKQYGNTKENIRNSLKKIIPVPVLPFKSGKSSQRGEKKQNSDPSNKKIDKQTQSQNIKGKENQKVSKQSSSPKSGTKNDKKIAEKPVKQTAKQVAQPAKQAAKPADKSADKSAKQAAKPGKSNGQTKQSPAVQKNVVQQKKATTPPKKG
jgi:hypothetical protein